jgi:uncharacterized protein YegL
MYFVKHSVTQDSRFVEQINTTAHRKSSHDGTWDYRPALFLKTDSESIVI